MDHSRILTLANIISSNTSLINSHLAAQNLPSPSFDPEVPADLLSGQGAEFEEARQSVVEAADELRTLLLGPKEYLMGIYHNTLLPLHFILRHNLHAFPQTTTFSSLATHSSQSLPVLKRLLRHAIAHHIFAEPSPNVLAHTPASRALSDPHVRAFLSFTVEELWPCATRTVDALERHPSAQDPAQTGFNLARGTEETFMVAMEGDRERGRKYGEMLESFRAKPEFAIDSLVEGVAWGEYDTVVDVGGSTGGVARSIAERYEGVKIVVQDFRGPVEEGRRNLPGELEGRVEFMEHDFFEEQPVKGADVYLLRWVLHDWSDSYAIRILRALVPALKKGARVILNETVLPPDEMISIGTRRLLRMMDLSMLELHNGMERDGEDWARLFAECDGRFQFESARPLPGAALGLVEAVWDP